MGRIISNALTVLSLLLCVATCVLWVRSYWWQDRISWLRGGERLSVVSSAGSLIRFAPPGPPSNMALRQSLESLTALMRNDQVFWVTTFDNRSSHTPVAVSDGEAIEYYYYPPRNAAFHLMTLPDTSPGASALLRALEDPNRFAAAHVLLTCTCWTLWPAPPPQPPEMRLIPNRFVSGTSEECRRIKARHARVPMVEVNDGGLLVTLDRWPTLRHSFLNGGKDTDSHGLLGTADPSQIPRLRDLWHQRLDVRKGSLPHWWAVAALLTGPALRAGWGTYLRRRAAARRRGKRCTFCSYDLSGNASGVCPECGIAIVRAG